MALARLSSGRVGAAFIRKLRFWMTVLVVFMLGWTLLGALDRTAVKAAELSANMVLSQISSALVIKGAEVMLEQSGDLVSQEGINPFELIEHQWPSYKGHCDKSMPDPGHWCFQVFSARPAEEVARGRIIYNPRLNMSLKERQARASEPLAWEVTTAFADRNRNGIREPTENLTGLTLKPANREASAR